MMDWAMIGERPDPAPAYRPVWYLVMSDATWSVG